MHPYRVGQGLDMGLTGGDEPLDTLWGLEFKGRSRSQPQTAWVMGSAGQRTRDKQHTRGLAIDSEVQEPLLPM